MLSSVTEGKILEKKKYITYNYLSTHLIGST